MSEENDRVIQNIGKVLTDDERDACRKIAVQNTGLAGLRAATLLAIDEGLTREEASERTGLKPGQIHYLMAAFRKKRLTMFPDENVSESSPPAESEKKVKSEKKSNKSKKEKSKEKSKAKEKNKKNKNKKDKKAKKEKKAEKKKKKSGKAKSSKKKLKK